MHILIVDDEALARSRLRTLLGDCPERHTVLEAANAAEALAQLRPTDGRGVDAVLLDIHMPGQDGRRWRTRCARCCTRRPSSS